MIIHTVKSGDSIYSIAREYGVTPSRIISDNLLKNPSSLVVGEDIIILYPTTVHTVRGGETLHMISTMYDTTLGEIYRNNPILDGLPNIYPGQVLNIAYGVPPLGEISSLGYTYPTIERSTLRRTLPYLTYLSVFSYGIREDGSLIIPEGDVEEILTLAREYETMPLLVLTSLSERGTFSSELATRILTDANLSEAVIRSVATIVAHDGYGGVDVDFEYIPAEHAQAYADFIHQMQAALGENHPVFVALAPKVQADQPGLLYEGHNYNLLGNAADRSLLMTYEWGYIYGPPLPVSPINEVRHVIDYAVTEIPRDKLFIGDPNYGYDWALPYIRGESRAQTLSNAAAVNLAKERQEAIQYDETAQAPFYTYYDRPETYSDAVEHIVWFQNAHSAEALLRLVEEYGLRGVGVWNIMRYFPAVWTVMQQLYHIRKI